MYYEFYIDQFAAEQFLIGCLLLAVTSRMLGRRIVWIRIAVGSFINSAIVILSICLGVPEGSLAGLLIAGLVTFYDRGRAGLAGAVCGLLAVTVCLEGMLEVLTDVLGLPVMAGITAAAVLLYAAASWYRQRRMCTRPAAVVQLYWEEQTLTVQALPDTGNQLREPLTGRAVSIIQADAAEKLLGEAWEQRRGFYLIPYHSLGTEKSWMRGVTIDRMSIEYAGTKIHTDTPILAIYEGRVSSTGRYQMILHPEHTQMG